MAIVTKTLVRLLVAVSVLWVLLAAGYVFWEYLSRNPLDQYPSNGIPTEFYFWKWSGVDLLAPVEQQVRTFEPTFLRIGSLLIGPPVFFWAAGYLFAWVANDFKLTD